MLGDKYQEGSMKWVPWEHWAIKLCLEVWEAFTDEVASEWEFEGGSGQMPEGRHLVLLSHVLHDCIYNQWCFRQPFQEDLLLYYFTWNKIPSQIVQTQLDSLSYHLFFY